MNTTNHAKDPSRSGQPRVWSDLDLEAFHDQALDADSHDQLAQSLLTDPALRERLARLRAREAAIIEALTLASRAGAPRAKPHRGLLPRAARLAALLLLTASAGLLIHSLYAPAPLLTPPHTPSHPGHAALAPATPTAPSTPTRTLFSMPLTADIHSRLAQRTPLRDAAGPTAPASTAARTPNAPAPDDLHQFTLALRSDRPEAAAVLLESLPAEAQARAMDALGESLRSAEVARRTLDTLTPEHQLAACQRWATDARLRPVAFDRLRDLQHKSALAPQYQRIIQGLQQDASLDGWIASYGLAQGR